MVADLSPDASFAEGFFYSNVSRNIYGANGCIRRILVENYVFLMLEKP
jgi:hypothetical protein